MSRTNRTKWMLRAALVATVGIVSTVMATPGVTHAQSQGFPPADCSASFSQTVYNNSPFYTQQIGEITLPCGTGLYVNCTTRSNNSPDGWTDLVSWTSQYGYTYTGWVDDYYVQTNGQFPNQYWPNC